MTEIICKEESYRLIGASFEVYNDKGNGFTEPIYQECLELELGMQQIPYQAQAHLPMTYKGRPLRQRFRYAFTRTHRDYWKKHRRPTEP